MGWHRRGRKADRLRPASVPRSARQRAQARPRAHPGRTAGSSTPPGRCKAAAPSISGCGAPLKSAIRRRSPPPTSSTCTRHTKQAVLPAIIIAPCAGTLGAPPHRSEPAQRPCSRRNRKPFRAGGRGRPAGAGGGENAAERTPNRLRSRRGRRFLPPWSPQQHPRRVSHQCSAGGGSASSRTAQRAVPRVGEARERRGGGRRTSQTPRRSPTEPVPPRSPTPEHSSAAPSAG